MIAGHRIGSWVERAAEPLADGILEVQAFDVRGIENGGGAQQNFLSALEPLGRDLRRWVQIAALLFHTTATSMLLQASGQRVGAVEP